MAFDYKFLLSPTGLSDSNILREFFEDIKLNLNDIPVDQIDSESATDGHVLTADGSGGAAWEAVAGGKVRQVVLGTSTTQDSTTSSTFVDGSLSASITPISTSSKILLILVQYCEATASSTGYLNIERDIGGTTDDVIGNNGLARLTTTGANETTWTATLVYLDSPSTTSAVTYRSRGKTGGAGTLRFGGVSSSVTAVIIAAEITA